MIVIGENKGGAPCKIPLAMNRSRGIVTINWSKFKFNYFHKVLKENTLGECKVWISMLLRFLVYYCLNNVTDQPRLNNIQKWRVGLINGIILNLYFWINLLLQRKTLIYSSHLL